MNTLDLQYQNLLKDILENGTQKGDRTGTGTISIFGRQIRHKMSEGFPLLTTKKMYFRGIVTELLWFLQGRTDLRYLLENECGIWTGDAYKVYDRDFDSENPPFSAPYPKRLTKKEFEKEILSNDEFNDRYGDLGPIYGRQWRAFGGFDQITKGWHHGAPLSFEKKPKYDQIEVLIKDLKTNPDSRRLMVTAWNPIDLDKQVLPPCHYGFQVYTRELSLLERVQIYGVDKIQTNDAGYYEHSYAQLKVDEAKIPSRAISLMWNQRSVDTPLGLPFNIASYGLLLEIIAKSVNMVPDELIGNLGDVHIYSNQLDGVKEQIGKDLTHEERIDWWFKNRKPNRDVVDEFDDVSIEQQIKYLNEANIPTNSRYSFDLPKLKIEEVSRGENDILPQYQSSDFTLEGYQSHPTIKFLLSN